MKLLPSKESAVLPDVTAGQPPTPQTTVERWGHVLRRETKVCENSYIQLQRDKGIRFNELLLDERSPLVLKFEEFSYLYMESS